MIEVKDRTLGRWDVTCHPVTAYVPETYSAIGVVDIAKGGDEGSSTPLRLLYLVRSPTQSQIDISRQCWSFINKAGIHLNQARACI